MKKFKEFALNAIVKIGLIVKSVWLIKQEYNKFNFSIKPKSMMTSKLTF